MATIYEPVVILKPEVVSIDDSARVDSFVKIEGGSGVRLGKYVHIASFAHLNIGGGTLEMDDYSAAASGVKIVTGSNDIEGLSCSAVAPATMQIVKRSKVVIGKYAVLFANAVVLPGVTLGEGSVAAAGAVVTKDIPAWEIWGGVPARKIGTRRNPLISPAVDAVAYIDPRSTIADEVNAQLPGTWFIRPFGNGCYGLHDEFGNYVMSLPNSLTAVQIIKTVWPYFTSKKGGDLHV